MALSRAFRRVYPQVGKIDTLHDIRELIEEIENDNIPNKLKRKRLHFMYALTFTNHFKKGWKGSRQDLIKARELLKEAYEERRIIIV